MTTPSAHAEGRGGAGPQPTSGNERAGGGVLELVTAAAGVALAIIGLAGVAPRSLDAIAVVLLGIAFVFERWTLRALLRVHVFPDHDWLAWESITGCAGIVLGVQSLLRPGWKALGAAFLLFGVGFIVCPSLTLRGARVMFGLAGVVLGILAIVRINPLTVTLIGSIVIGAGLALTGPVFAGSRHMARR